MQPPFHAMRNDARDLADKITIAIMAGRVKTRHAKKNLFQLYYQLEDELRFMVMHSIASTKNKLARDLLVDILHHDPSVLVRHEAAFALGCIGNSADLPHIKRALRTDKNALVRHEAAMALGVFGNLNEIAALRGGIRDNDEIVSASCRAAIELIYLRYRA
jgi:HEAT repeat protein